MGGGGAAQELEQPGLNVWRSQVSARRDAAPNLKYRHQMLQTKTEPCGILNLPGN